ncbi:hypothetical protein LOSG293_150290 [Secundilactobacillus oryzae JCM 18671]|uniref:DUF2785 domain-containing protein n=1 Tax=Secundilactobacillus oryzae JCM 18671 TaxID=1291743 RepID=A0A081BIS0_9LACO|nr:DUF2785 domain-containing protein [Secundilactobacillus oryzae]GAK47938.1 hypothetical protein LOSG293_150290 [Secundilactobacillus oryzae JCM 18671]
MGYQTIETIRRRLAELKDQLYHGELYRNLGTELDQLMTDIEVQPRTAVELPGDEGIKELLLALNTEIRQDELDAIDDDQLKLLISHLGSLDPQVRDKGVYYFLNDAIQMHIITKEQLIMITDYLLQDEILFSHILEPQNDAVYQRSFAVLFLSVIAFIDRNGGNFLTRDRIDRLTNQFELYMTLERDTRGYIGTQGWAHAYTHVGNLIDELANRDELRRADKLFEMAILLSRFKLLKTPLIFGETNRISAYLANVTNKNKLYEDYVVLEMKKWSRRFMLIRDQESEAMWTQIYNQARLFGNMRLRNDFSTQISNLISNALED